MKRRILSLIVIVAISIVLLSGCTSGDTDPIVITTPTISTTTDPVQTDDVTDAVTSVSETKPIDDGTTIVVPSSSGTTVSTQQTNDITTTTTQTTTTTTTGPKPTYTLTPLSKSAYYGYTLLKAMPNGSVLTGLYDDMVEAVETLDQDVEVNVSVTVDDLLKVFYYYRADYPQHFWCDGNINYYTRNDQVVRFELRYNMNEAQVVAAKAAVEREVDALLKIAATGKDEYERELLLHDALAKKITYRDGKNSHTLYGALVEGKAVCEGYARSLQYLLYQCGIQCLIAEGSGVDPSTGKPEPHAWNVVWIAGQYYFVDLTWDDPDKADIPVMYPYFNVSATQLKEDHTIDTSQSYPLPSCTATAANYHVKNGTRLTHFTVDNVSAAIKINPKETHLYIAGDRSEFIQWFEKNHAAVVKAVGISGKYQYSLLYMGNEIVISISQ